MASSQEIEQKLRDGITAAKTGQLEQARFQLLDVVEQDQTNETAWYWLYQVFDQIDDKRICLENLVIINPGNQWAKQELLLLLEAASAVGKPPKVQKERKQPNRQRKAAAAGPVVKTDSKGFAESFQTSLVSLKLVIAFWAGISVIFLSSGIIASGDWLLSAMRTRGFLSGLTILQFLQLLVAISFLTSGMLGFFIAVALYFRSMLGFYGSILLALGLLLIGPTVSLIAYPPSYLTMICTGGVSGVIFLLTLASQPEFKNSSQDDKPNS